MAFSPHLCRLEAEAIHIMREVVADFERPVMLYSIGKDSGVRRHVAFKAFYPAEPPFALLRVDTTWKFRQMSAFCTGSAARLGLGLVVHVVEAGMAGGISPVASGSAPHTRVIKTETLRQALDNGRFDVAFGEARRDEENSRANEQIFSHRAATQVWDPRNQRPELWRLLNTRIKRGESMRLSPPSNWTEFDVWEYIAAEEISVVPLYFAKERPVVDRDGALIIVDDDRSPLASGERSRRERIRFQAARFVSALACDPFGGYDIVRYHRRNAPLE